MGEGGTSTHQLHQNATSKFNIADINIDISPKFKTDQWVNQDCPSPHGLPVAFPPEDDDDHDHGQNVDAPHKVLSNLAVRLLFHDLSHFSDFAPSSLQRKLCKYFKQS